MVQRTSDRPKTTFGRPQWQIEPGNSRVPLSSIPPSPNQSADAGNSELPIPMWIPGIYGDMQYKQITYLALGPFDQLVLLRPVRAQRVFMLIQNNFAAGNILINFDNPASALNGIPINPGGNFLCDNAVPQNDIHVFGPGAGTINISYMEVDITDSEKILRTMHR